MLEKNCKSQISVTVAGFINTSLGLGQAVRGHITALRQVGIEPSLVDISFIVPWAVEKNVTLGEPTTALPACELLLLEVNPDQLPRVVQHLGLQVRERRPFAIGLWVWETMEIPDWWKAEFGRLDEIWAPSAFVASAISRSSPIPTVVVPYCIDVLSVRPEKAAFGMVEGEFTFLFIFDFKSYPERKNPRLVIDAFRSAFTPDEPVRLVIKSINADDRSEEVAALQDLATGLRVTIFDKALDSADRYSLIGSCDAFVSLHRAEGFGLGIAEAMGYGKPVIATGWSGNMEFMNQWNSFPVDYTLVPLEADAGPYPKGSLWAVPSLEDAARLMRYAWQNPELACKVGERAKKDIAKNFGPEAIGKRMADRIAEIERHRADRQLVQTPALQETTASIRLLRVAEILRNEGLNGILNRILRPR